MTWAEIREQYPDRWLVIEALAMHDEADYRIFDEARVAMTCGDGAEAMQQYAVCRQEHPGREFTFIHTSYPELRFRMVRRGVLPRRVHTSDPR